MSSTMSTPRLATPQRRPRLQALMALRMALVVQPMAKACSTPTYLAVQAQVFLIVNDAATSPTIDKSSGGWKIESHTNAVMYPGSTTGVSHDNTICSPYAVTWHVDKACHKISAASFDKMCLDMKTLFGLEHDIAPHGSRKIVDAAFVVPAASVKPLA